ncbi:DUF397 domain-containing protein [Streptomyces griseoviridis]|jgi:hypothetical protein|uniref:DUF397 domain-containing protein n=1 Tax=Streptomyces griseoviridis TaxID=45398 RepID=A0A918GL95_STRGD|nr:DUF397 domain-containing protein [Streptomyces niveoruber]GGS41046.1 hypothetical protein GCM10010238_33160 [Streptomyces niveoruber]
MSELDWFKSSYSGSEGDSCVEVAQGADGVYVRDSKVADGPVFAVEPSAWGDFLGFVGV